MVVEFLFLRIELKIKVSFVKRKKKSNKKVISAKKRK